MKERFLGPGHHEQIKIYELHPDFNKESGRWAFNHFWDSAKQGPIKTKIRAGFNDLSCLDAITHSAKIGINADEAIPFKYILFVYGGEEESDSLRALARQLPYSEIIHNTASTGVETELSFREMVNG